MYDTVISKEHNMIYFLRKLKILLNDEKIENENIVFNNGRNELKILVKDFEDGTVIVQTDEFIPQITKAKSQCTSCTNCGRCSW